VSVTPAGVHPSASESARSGRRTRPTAGAALLAVIVVGLLFAATLPLRSYLAQRAILDRAERQAQVLQRQNVQLRHQVEQLNDPAYLERTARECLGMVRPGEILFTPTTRSGRAIGSDGARNPGLPGTGRTGC
jgi:cell division protein FtsB